MEEPWAFASFFTLAHSHGDNVKEEVRGDEGFVLGSDLSLNLGQDDCACPSSVDQEEGMGRDRAIPL